ncbi:MAG: hypothetical protein JW902_15080 [Syntrophaceae bacterium]|nr:hypothetical protein [Syntrophaceae bacterium]
MRHGHHILSGVEPWLLVIALLAFVCLIGIIVWVLHRRTVTSDGLTPAERKNLPYPHREILSMLRQHGEPMLQSEIADMMPIYPEELAETLKCMEAEGLVHRRWESKSCTYLISTQPWSSGGGKLPVADEGESERL